MGWQDRYEAYLQKNKEEEQQKKREQQRRNPVTTNEQGNSSLKRYTEWKLRTGRIQEDVAARVEALAGADENFYTAYASRFGNRNGTDGGKYISDAAEQYQSAMQQRKQFDIKADSILQALDQYGEYFDQDWAASVRDYLGKARTNQDNMLLDYAADSRYWAQFGNEEGYLRYLNPEKYGRQDRQAQYAANNQRIEELKKQKAAVKRPENGYLTGGAMPQSSPYGAALQAPKKDPADNEITMLETWNRNYERGNGGYSKAVDDYATIAERDDFKTVSAKRDYDNPTREDLFNYDRSVSEGNLSLTNGGSFDDLGNIVDREGNIVQLADGGKIHDRLGLYLSASEEDKAEAYNLLSASNGNYTNTWANLIQTGDEGSWNQLSENEVAIYYYLLNNDGQETADKYLDDMKVELNRRQTQWESQEQARNLAEAGTLEKVMLNVATVPAQLFGGAVGFADDAINLIQGKDINPYSSRHALSNFSGTIRETQAAELEAATNGAAIPFINYTVGDLYQSGMSFVDTRVGGLLGPNTYMALMGMGSASAEAKKLYEQGASNMEIAWGGALAGAAEMIFEKVSIDKLIDIKDPKTGWDIVKNILIQGGVEASEEVATEIANTITNALVMTDRSDWARLVEENNGDEFAAFKAKVADVGKAALGGFFSGAGSGGTYSVERYVAGQRQSAQTGQYIDEHLYGSDALMALAEEVAGYAPPKLRGRLEAQSGKLHDAVYDGNGSRGKAAGKLYGTVRTAITQQNQADIAKGLQELEGPEGKRFTPRQARAIAEAAAASMNGEKLTERQQKTLDRFQSDSSVRDVVMEVAGGEQATRLDAFHAAIATDTAKTFRGGAQPASQGATQTAPRAAEQADAQTPGNVYGTEKTPSQGRYEVSDSGSAQLLHTGEPVSIRSVAEIRDGKMTLELKDGRKVSAEEISYANEDEALVYEAVAEMGVDATAANVLVGAYHTDTGVSAEAYSLGVKEAYKYGQYNFPMQEVVNGPFSSMLTDHQRNTAYRLGQMFSEKQTAKAQAAAQGTATAEKNSTVGKVHFDGDYSKLSERQSASLSALKTVADALGVQIHIFESGVDADRQRTGANGWYDAADSTIHIDLYSGVQGKDTMLFTAAHELTHFIRDWSPAKFKVLADFLMQEYGKQGVSVDTLVQNQIIKAKRGGREISYDTAFEEVVADSMETMLSDGKVAEKLAKLKVKDKTLWEKMKDFFRDLAEKIQAAYKGLKPDSVEGRYVAEMKDAVEQLQELFTEGLTDAGENFQRAEKNTAREGGVFKDNVAQKTTEVNKKFSMREPVERAKNLVALHNLTEDKLVKALELGGFPMPSIAITKADIPHTNFGDITLVFGSEVIDPKKSKKNVVYSADAWTPVFPRIEYEADDKIASQVHSRLSGLSKQVDEFFRRDLGRVTYDMEDILNRYDGEEGLIQYALENYGLKAAYLEEHGEHIQPETRQEEVTLGVSPEMEDKYLRILEVLDIYTPEQVSGLILKDVRDKHGKELEEIYPGVTKSALRLGRVLNRIRAYLSGVGMGTEYKTVTDAAVTNAAIDSKLDSGEYEAWVRDLFRNIEKSRGVRNNKDRFAPSGNRRTFKQTHLPATLENIVKAMATQNGGSTKNVSGFNGIKSLRAGTAKRFRSIAEMHEYEGRLQNLTKDQLTEIQDQLGSRLYDIIKAIDEEGAQLGGSNSLIRYDSIGETLTEIAEGGRYNVSDIQKTFAEYRKELSDELAAQVKELLFDVTQMPVNIFEAKPERVVLFEEIRAAILPNDTSEGVVDGLRGHGVPVHLYEPGNNAARLDLVNSLEGVRFSDRDPEQQQVNRVLEKENAKLREDVTYLKEMLKLQRQVTGGTKFTKSSVEAMAGILMKNNSAKGSKAELAAHLNGLYEYIAKGEELTWEGVAEKAQPAVEWIQNHIESKPRMDEYATEILRKLRTSRVYLDESQKQEAAYLCGSYNDFRKRMLGTIVVSDKASVSLDTQWGELTSLYPGVFDATTSASDMPRALMDAVDSLRGMNVIDEWYNRADVAQDLLRQVYDGYWKVSTLQTVADVKQKQINRLKAEHNTRMEKIKSDHREKIDQLKTEHHNELVRAKVRYLDAGETVSKNKQRKIIEKQVKDLTKMIANPTKDAHVPTVLHKPLQKLLDSLDFTSEKMAGGGEATVRDVAYTRALQSIRTAIAAQRTAMEGVEDGAFALDVPPEFLDKIDGHIKMINDATEGMDLTTNRVYDMNSDELKDLAYLLGTINKAVRNIDKLHMEGAKARVSELAESTVREMGQRKPVKGEDGGGLMWANYTPTYAFERMGTAATQILDGLKQGQAKMARTVDGVLKFAAKTYDAKEVKAWQEKIHTVKLESGETVKLTTAQIMSFYCLSNRDQGVGHLTGGGIRVGTIGEGPGKTVQKQHFRLTVQDINQINGLLDKRQLEVAKAMQKYMQDVGGRLGNEISMARWGFMQMTEENYFPIRSDSDVHDGKNPDQEKANLWALLNKSFTKSVTKGANDAVVVSSIFDVFADHMAEMAEYNAFALPLVDAMKWYNYRSTTRMDGSQIETVGVKKSLNDTLGTAAGKYFIDLMTDINSSQKGGRHEDIMGKLLSYSKGSAVGWNLRVAIQQPTAILRASLYLDMPDLARGSLRIGTKELVEEMQKYSGIAMWKSLGYYDLNVSRSVREQIKGNTNLVDTFNEWGMWLPGKVDEITWARIWAACKSKVSRTQNLKGEALLKETAKLFDDVVYHTQVVDSVLTKSSLMRSKSQIMKEFTSFMSEPTVSVNILMSAFQDYRQGKTNWEKAKRTFAICFKGYALSAMANALVTAFADAFRDDDEYEEFWEKYQQALLGEKFVDGNLIAELNPLEKLVFVKDALSLMRGYDVQNAYIKLVKGFIDLVNDIKKYLEGKGSITEYGVIYNALKVLGNFTGAAPANLARELVTIWNNTFGKLSGKKIHRYQTETKDAIHNAFDAGTLTREEAMQELVLAQEAENEDEAYFQVKKWETGEDSKYDGLYEALEKNEGVDAAVKELTDHGVKEKDAQEQIRKKLKTWYTDPESEIQMSRKDILSRLKKYAGLDSDEAEEVVKKWDMEKETGFIYDELREQYVDGNISEKEAISYMQKYGGKTKEEAQDQMEDWTKSRFFDGDINADKAAKVLTNHCGWEKADAENKVRYWDFKRSHPGVYVDDAWLDEYDIMIRESGIALEIFIAYRNKVKGINGKGRKDRRMDVIDSLPITDEQKDAIYFAEGWAASTLNEASWHQR